MAITLALNKKKDQTQSAYSGFQMPQRRIFNLSTGSPNITH